VKLLGSASVGVQEAAAGALRNLAGGNADLKAVIAAEPGCIPALTLLSHSNDVSVRQAAAWALGELAT
jgi:HEAT repeat protein